MDIVINTHACEKIKEKFEIVMSTYTDGGDIYEEYKFFVEKKDIQRNILEALFFQYQYFEERENFCAMYDQINYFCHNKNTFTWIHNFPENDRRETHYILEDFNVFYYDTLGDKYPVDIKNTKDLLADIHQINQDFEIGNVKVWDNLSYKDDKYKKYCDTVNTYIEKYILEHQLQNNDKKNKKLKI